LPPNTGRGGGGRAWGGSPVGIGGPVADLAVRAGDTMRSGDNDLLKEGEATLGESPREGFGGGMRLLVEVIVGENVVGDETAEDGLDEYMDSESMRDALSM
jgi:hypothetical protein